MSTKIKLALTAAIFLWASAYVGIRASLQDYSPEGLALLRYLVASVCMSIVYYRAPQRTAIPIRDVLALLMIGVLGIGVYNITLNYGELYVSSSMTSFVISQAPIVSTIFALIFLGEKVVWRRSLGLLVSVFGVVLIAAGGESSFHFNQGFYFILIATVAGGLFSVLQKPYLKKYHSIEATTYIIWGATLFLAIYTPQLQHDLMSASLKSTLIVIYLGIFPAAIAYLAWSYILAEMPASRAVSFLYFTPFIATLIGWIWLKEMPMLLSLLGGLIAISGVCLVNQSYKLEMRH